MVLKYRHHVGQEENTEVGNHKAKGRDIVSEHFLYDTHVAEKLIHVVVTLFLDQITGQLEIKKRVGD
jgi:hypothetical protein